MNYCEWTFRVTDSFLEECDKPATQKLDNLLWLCDEHAEDWENTFVHKWLSGCNHRCPACEFHVNYCVCEESA